MFKFFRKYNNYILVIGVVVLMVAFLIQPVLSIFMPDPAQDVIGTLESEELTLGQRRGAANQLDLLASAFPLLRLPESVDAMQWMLAMRDAEAMGLSASIAEVDLLVLMINRWIEAFNAMNTSNRPVPQLQLERIAKRLRVSVESLRGVLRDRIVYEDYKSLVAGLQHVSLIQQLDHQVQMYELTRQGMTQLAYRLSYKANPMPRISVPRREHFLHDLYSRVRVTAALVDAQAYLHRVEQPAQQEVEDLFDRYKNDLPGQSEPNGIGYRFADRVKLEYLSVPFNRLRQTVQIEEADALSYYDRHPHEFKIALPSTQPGDAPPDSTGAITQPYEVVRGQIVDQLKDEQATALGDRIMKSAQAMLLEDARSLDESEGYRVVTPDWQPISLQAVADRLKKQFGVQVDVSPHDQEWLTREGLAQLPGIREAFLVGTRTYSFVSYATSARELLDPDTPHPLASLRLQAMLPSSPLISASRGRYLFRLTAAQRSHPPDSLEEVRPQVVEDARRLAAYELAKQDIEMWHQRARTETLEGLASQADLTLINPPAFAKHEPAFSEGQTGRLQPPNIEAIGRDQSFVDAVFDLSQRTREAGGVQQVPPDQRLVVLPIDRRFSLALARLDETLPMTRKDAEMMSLLQPVDTMISLLFNADLAVDPLSFDAIADRVGYKPAHSDADPGVAEPPDSAE